MTNRLDKIRLDKKRGEEKRRESVRERKNEPTQNPHPPSPKNVEAIIKETSKTFSEGKTPKPKRLDTSETAFSKQMNDYIAKKKGGDERK